MMVGVKVTKTGQWSQASAVVNTMIGTFSKAQRQATLKEAHLMRAEIVKGIRSGAPGGVPFKPLAPTTLAVRALLGRGGKKPLIVSGGLRNSIRVKEQGDAVFVGVLRSADKGKANIAELNEFGSRPIVVPITAKSRRFLMAAFRKAGTIQPSATGTTVAVIRIPPRPFVRPVAESQLFAPAVVKKRFERNLAIGMGGILGTV